MGHPYKEPSDVWALGVIMFELLTLQRPFSAPNIGALILKICSVDYDEACINGCPHPAPLADLATKAGTLLRCRSTPSLAFGSRRFQTVSNPPPAPPRQRPACSVRFHHPHLFCPSHPIASVSKRTVSLRQPRRR